VPGEGIAGLVDGVAVGIGTPGFVGAAAGEPGRTLVSVGGRVGWVRLAVPEREGIEDAVRALGRSYEICLLSGDHGGDRSRWTALFGEAVAFQQTPEAKLSTIEALRGRGGRVLMLGDGLNDAGALAAAHVGVAVSDQTACVVPACDAVIGGGQVRHLGAILQYARHARRVIVVAFAISIVYNAVGLSLAWAGALTPLASAILMPVSSLTVVALGTGGMRWAARRLPS
jgi:Cu+-exporting ATPase